ncbi:hypothetical protein OPT61_g9236 [Boeremia exigua]|uniref:Uncharacterized protein n=1 Tax=Boeremia exigua TaxID=749465 RepID=A0ACC2HV09_9PLEO|nr:hypothetical protein OPT61_g9236 [Boeremia exigua]
MSSLSSDHNVSFRHQPLDTNEQSIRLIRLLGGSEGPVRCEIFHAQLDEASIIEYEALSYIWGGTSQQNVIEANGMPLRVTENLLHALLELQQPEEDRILWIDAMCIDQANTGERNHQVRLMSIIYQRATRVIIWLGTATNQTDVVFDHMKVLQQQSLNFACNSWQTYDRRWKAIWTNTLLVLNTLNQDVLCAGLKELLSRAWFTRVWIIQEVANARSAIVLCGNRSVSARIFALAPSLAGVEPHSKCQVVLDIMPGPSRKFSWWSERPDLRVLLNKFKYSEASDPRDRIYALLALSSDEQILNNLQPDYELVEGEVVDRVARYLLGIKEGTGCLPPWSMDDFLDSVGSLEVDAISNAAANGDTLMMSHLIHAGYDVNSRDLSPHGILTQAMENGHEAMVGLLLQTSTLEINRRDVRGWTPLISAARNGQELFAKWIIETRDVDVNARDSDNWTPLMHASAHNHHKVTKLLLSARGTDADAKDKLGRTALMHAVHNDSIEVLRMLCSDKTSLAAKDQSVLVTAAAHGHIRVVEVLLSTERFSLNAINEEGYTAISAGIKGNHFKIVQLLYSRQCDLRQRADDRSTMLIVAAQNGHFHIATVLINLWELLFRVSDLRDHAAVTAAKQNGHPAVMQLFRTHLYEIIQEYRTEKNESSNTSMIDRLQVAQLLLDAGEFDVNARDHAGRTALHVAAKSGHLDIMRRLLFTKGLDTKGDKNGSAAALLAAAKVGDVGLFWLIREKVNTEINSGDAKGYTPLMLAVQGGHENMIRGLLRAGAAVNYSSFRSHNRNAQSTSSNVRQRHTTIPNQPPQAVRAAQVTASQPSQQDRTPNSLPVKYGPDTAHSPRTTK